jgi:GTP-binding protein EngB required for normal cell division
VIDVAFLGQFKAGKSSLINALIGSPILPVGVIPVTTAITRLQYGPTERALVRCFDGTQFEIEVSTIGDFTSEARNPGNQKNIEYIDIELPALIAYKGLRLVDTPGLGSVFKYHQETSETWLPEVGAALLVISVDRPLSEGDLQLIHELKSYTPRIVLILTKTDLLSPDQQEEIFQFLKRMLQKETNQEFLTFQFSTKQNTEKWKEILEDELLLKISANHYREIESILHHKIISLGKACLSYMEIALKASQEVERERARLHELILDEKTNYDRIREEFTRIATENAEQTRPLIMNRLEKLHASLLTKRLQENLKKSLPSWRGNLWKFTRSYETWLKKALNEELFCISKNEGPHFFGTLKKAHAGLSRSVETFKRLLAENVERVLGIKLSKTEWHIEVTEPTQPDIKIGRTFDFHLDMFWFLIPMFIFKPLFERHYLNQIPWVVEVNLSRLAAQWEERINQVIEDMKKQALEYVRDEITTIESLLLKREGNGFSISKEIAELSGELKNVEANGKNKQLEKSR